MENLKQEIEYLQAKINIYENDLIRIQEKVFDLMDQLTQKQFELKNLEGAENDL